MTVERERKFLIDQRPDLPAEGDSIIQGYLAIDGEVEVRVRRRNDSYVMTLKAGGEPSRVEVEHPITAEQFDLLWPHTAGRRISKIRYEIPDGEATIEVDVFGAGFDDLILAEVEFDSEDSMAGYRPPNWFGPEVTDDPAFSNARLAR